MDELNELSKSLKETLTDSDFQDLSVSVAETIMDAAINDGLVKDIPIIGTIVGLCRTTINIKERLFIKKLVYFLSEIKDIPKERRKKMISEINNSEQFGVKVGEKLLYLIDKCDDHVKAKLIAKIFAAYLNEKISYVDFIKASTVIDRAMISDLMWFIEGDWHEFSIEESGDAINYGLFEITPISLSIEQSEDMDFDNNFKIKGAEIKTQITVIGRKIRDILKEKP